METIVKQGRLLFAVAIAALGAENLICAHVFTKIVLEGNPNGVPVLPYATSPFIAYLVGIILLAVGVSVAASIRPEFAASFLGLFFFLYTLIHLLPIIVARPRDLNARTRGFEVLALCASALTLSRLSEAKTCFCTPLHGRNPGCIRGQSNQHPDRLGPLSFRDLLGCFRHHAFAHSPRHRQPRARLDSHIWAYFTGAAFIAAGISIVTGVLARWGAFWQGVMLLLWFLMLHAPRVALHPRIPAEWSSLFRGVGHRWRSLDCGQLCHAEQPPE